MISQQNDHLAGWRHLDGAARDGCRQDFISLQVNARRLKTQAHPIKLGAHPARDGCQPRQCSPVKRIRMRTAEDPNLPGTADRQAMAVRPGIRERRSVDHGTGGEPIAPRKRPAEAATKSPTLTERPAAENDGDVNAASHGNIGS